MANTANTIKIFKKKKNYNYNINKVIYYNYNKKNYYLNFYIKPKKIVLILATFILMTNSNKNK